MRKGKEYVMTVAAARKVARMLNGESVGYSSFPVSLAEELLEEGVLVQSSYGRRGSYRICDVEGCRTFLAQRYAINGSLEEWIEMMSRREAVSRAEQVAMAGNSKVRKTRGFKGFLVNSYSPIEATLREQPLVIDPVQGTSIFIEDYFQRIRGQQYLFDDLKVLFVSRYPQSTDLRTWLQMIPNRYIHFGDFDLAGIDIFQREFYAFLRERSEFFIPADVEERLKNGNRRLYDVQYARYKFMDIMDERLLPLVEMIHRYGKGYEQEGYIIG